MLDVAVIVKVTDEPLPELKLPVPLHPVHAYRVSDPPAAGDVTDSVMDDPASK